MPTKRELHEAEDRGWHELCARFDAIAHDAWEKPGAAGDWSPKDVMAHVACWHAETVRQFEAFRSAGQKVWWPDVEEFNAESYGRCRDMRLREVQAMSGAARHRFREEIALLEEPLPERFPRWIEASGIGHYQEHIPLLDAFLGRAP